MHTKVFTITPVPMTIKTHCQLHLTHAFSSCTATLLHIKRPNKALITFNVVKTHPVDLRIEDNTVIYCESGEIKLFYNTTEFTPMTTKIIKNEDVVENMRIIEISCDRLTNVSLEVNKKRAFVCRIERGTKRVCLNVERAKFYVDENVKVEGYEIEAVDALIDENDIIFNEMTSVFEEEDRKLQEDGKNDKSKNKNKTECIKKTNKFSQAIIEERKNVDKENEHKHEQTNKKFSVDEEKLIEKHILDTDKHIENAINDKRKVNEDNMKADLECEKSEKTTEVNEQKSTEIKIKDKVSTQLKVKIDILEEGKGIECKNGDKVKILYKGYLRDNTVFQEMKTPFTFVLGSNNLIEGMQAGVLGMKKGEKRKIMFGPKLGYGRKKTGIIPKNSDLIFEITLVDILKR